MDCHSKTRDHGDCTPEKTRVTRNVSHFKKFYSRSGPNHENAESGDEWYQESEDCEPEDPNNPRMELRPPAEVKPGDANGPGPQVERSVTEQGQEDLPTQTSSRGSQSRYHLRDNPRPSGRLRDYALTCRRGKQCLSPIPPAGHRHL